MSVRNEQGKETTDRLPRMLLLSLAGCALMPMANAGALAKVTAALPDVPAPPQGEVQWVARSMRMNGLPMTLKTFQSRLDPEHVLNHYESIAGRWGRNEYRRSTVNGNRLLSIRSARYHITVEARGTVRGCEGTITVSTPPEQSAAAVRTAFPHPPTARIVSRQEYEDDGIEAEHLSLSSARSATVEAQAFVTLLQREGWQIVRHQGMQEHFRGVLIEAQRGAQQALLTLQPDRSRPSATAIVVVWRKS